MSLYHTEVSSLLSLSLSLSLSLCVCVCVCVHGWVGGSKGECGARMEHQDRQVKAEGLTVKHR